MIKRLHHWLVLSIAFMVALLAACKEGSQEQEAGATVAQGCDGFCSGAGLTISDLQTILAQAIFEAQANSTPATIAIADRAGNILGVYRMADANPDGVTLTTHTGVSGGLEGLVLPPALDALAAIAKALSGAYLSSEGNAFSTRTAGQIIQQHFNPGELLQPGGPLFGVQFSQLACSDVTTSMTQGSVGPQRSPLGLSADPGGFPLYKNGTLVGGVGVIADGEYSLDLDPLDQDNSIDERIAYAATYGYSAPLERRAERITVEGKLLRFSDVDTQDLSTNPAFAPAFATYPNSVGTVIPVKGYSNGALKAGTVFAEPASGIRADDGAFADLDGFILVDAGNRNRYPAQAGAEGIGALTATETTTILRSALSVANRTRAQIRQPLNSPARVTISLVDSLGNVLGIVRSRDAPLFGVDVSLQKARTAAFYSAAQSAALIESLPVAQYRNPDLTPGISIDLGAYLVSLRHFLGLPAALADGRYAFTDRAGGNLSRPYFPDGIDGNPHGPLSKPGAQWSVFSTGFQLDAVFNAIVQHVLFVAGEQAAEVTTGCLGKGATAAQDVAIGSALANGMQIFPGSVPVYRGELLVGGLGVSGDGVDQDDLIAFLGLDQAALAEVGNAPLERRADQLTPQGIRLRYVQCPVAPFLDSDQQNACEGK